MTGELQIPDYVTDTETQREYQNPTVKRVNDLRHIEENRLGRYAYSQNRSPPNGICKLLLRNDMHSMHFFVVFSA